MILNFTLVEFTIMFLIKYLFLYISLLIEYDSEYSRLRTWYEYHGYGPVSCLVMFRPCLSQLSYHLAKCLDDLAYNPVYSIKYILAKNEWTYLDKWAQ